MTQTLEKVLLVAVIAIVLFTSGCSSDQPTDPTTVGTFPDEGENSFGFWESDSEFVPGEIAVVFTGSKRTQATSTTILINGAEVGSDLPVALNGSITFIVPPLNNGVHKLHFQIDDDPYEFDFTVSSRAFTPEMEHSITATLESDILALSGFTHEDSEVNYEVETAIIEARSTISNISSLTPEEKIFVYNYLQSLKALTSVDTEQFDARAIFNSNSCDDAVRRMVKGTIAASASAYIISSSGTATLVFPLLGPVLGGAGVLALYKSLYIIRDAYRDSISECIGESSFGLVLDNQTDRRRQSRAASNFTFVATTEYLFGIESVYEYDERIVETINPIKALLSRFSSILPTSMRSFFDDELPEPEGSTDYSDFQITAISHPDIAVNTAAGTSSLGVTFSLINDELAGSVIPFTFDLVKLERPDLTQRYSASLQPDIDYSGHYRTHLIREYREYDYPFYAESSNFDRTYTADYSYSDKSTFIERSAEGEYSVEYGIPYDSEILSVGSGIFESTFTYTLTSLGGPTCGDSGFVNTNRYEEHHYILNLNNGTLSFEYEFTPIVSSYAQGDCEAGWADRNTSKSRGKYYYVIHPDDLPQAM